MAAGVREVELTSFVRPDRVPALVDAESLAAATADSPVVRWGLVLNERGADSCIRSRPRSLAIRRLGLGDSQPGERRSIGRREFRGARGDPDCCAERVHRGDLGDLVRLPVRGSGADRFDHRSGPTGDRLWRRRHRSGRHDRHGGAVGGGSSGCRNGRSRWCRSRGSASARHARPCLANAFAAVANGAIRLDASLGGLGGCPFAPGASGNLAIEDLAHGLEAENIVTDVDVARLIDAAHLATRVTGRTIDSHVGRSGPRFANVVQAST